MRTLGVFFCFLDQNIFSFLFMKKQDKIFEVQNLKAKVKDAKALAVADYRGLSVAQMNQLRKKVREAGGELQVAKNNLFFRALRESNYEIDKSLLDGPSLVLFANEDEISPLKALVAFSKGLNLLALKVGFMADQAYSAEELTKLANLPGRLELQAKLVGLLSSPPRRLVYSLNYNLQKLVLLIDGISKKKAN